MDELKNCPNCGGTLDDNGRCQYCGTKVYDFLIADFDNPKPIWLRFKSHGNIHMVPARLISTETRMGYAERPMEFEVVGPEEVLKNE